MPPVPPRQGGGEAYPSGTPPYGVPSDPAFSRAGAPPQGAPGAPAAPGTPSAAGAGGPAGGQSGAGSGDEPKATETTLTTRIKINIPGSRPIPPVVVREPVSSAQSGAAASAEQAAAPNRRHRSEAPGSPVLGVMDSGSQPSVPPDLPAEWRTSPPAASAQQPGQGQASGGGSGSSWFAPRKKVDGPSGPGGGDAQPQGRPTGGIDPFAAPPAEPPAYGNGTAPLPPEADAPQGGPGLPGRNAGPNHSPNRTPNQGPAQPGAAAGAFGPTGSAPAAQAPGASPYTAEGAGAGLPRRDPMQGPFGPAGDGPTPGSPHGGGFAAGERAGADPFTPGPQGAQAARRDAETTQAFPAVGADLGSPGATQTHGSGINPFAPEAGAFPPPPGSVAPAPAPGGIGGGASPFPPPAQAQAPVQAPSPAAQPQGVYAPKPQVGPRAGAGRPAGMSGGLTVNSATAPPTAPQPSVETTARLRPVGDGFAGGTGGAGAPPRPEPAGATQDATGQGKAEKPKKAPSKARKLAGYGVGAVVVLGGVAYGAGLMLNQADVPRGTTVLGTAIGGDSRDQAVHTLDGTLGKLATKPLQLSLNGRQLTLSPEVAGLTVDTEATVAQVTHHSYAPGTVLNALLGSGNAVAPVVQIDGDKLRAALSRLAAAGSAREGSVRFSAAGKPVVTLPKSGSGLDLQAAVALVEQAYRNRAAGAKEGTVTLPVTTVKPKSTAASTNQAAQTLGKWAMQSKLFHVTAGATTVDFGPRTFSMALTLRPDSSGAFAPVFDLAALKGAYGSKFAGAKVNGKPVTAQEVADALTTLLSKPNGPTTATLK